MGIRTNRCRSCGELYEELDDAGTVEDAERLLCRENTANGAQTQEMTVTLTEQPHGRR